MTTEELTALQALLAKMTPGTLIAAGWGDGSTLNGMTNIFNEDAEVLLMECIPEHDASGIVALVNAAPALLASAARAAELEAEVARLRGGPLITYRKGFGPGDGDSAVLEQKP